MAEDRGKRVRAERSGDEIDRLSSLPDSLRIEILLKLYTKDAVKTSVLSSRWRNLWRFVPGLDLEYGDFREPNALVSFIDTFLGFNSDSRIRYFKLIMYNWYENPPDFAHHTRWINTVVNRKIQHLHVTDMCKEDDELQLPPAVYTCEILVSLKLSYVTLPNPEFVSLPSLKAILLDTVKFADDSVLETLISGCPVLERLGIERSLGDETEVLTVRSQSLLSLTIVSDCEEEDFDEHLVVAIDAPRLKYLRLRDYRTASFVLDNTSSLVKADIDAVFSLSLEKKFDPNDLQKRDMIRKFLAGISRVQGLIIAWSTLEVIYDYSRCESLPLFKNLSFLRVVFFGYQWEMLPIILERCPNLKFLAVGARYYEEKEGIHILPETRRVLASLEYVEIDWPFKGVAMKLVRYLLEPQEIHSMLGWSQKERRICYPQGTTSYHSETLYLMPSGCSLILIVFDYGRTRFSFTT